MSWLTRITARIGHNPYVAALKSSKVMGLISVGLLLCAGTLAISKWHVDAHTEDLKRSVMALETSSREELDVPGSSRVQQQGLPPSTQYFSDVNVLQKTVRDSGLAVLGIEYKSESQSKLPVQLKFITVRSSDDYPRIKRFLSLLMERLPNASVHDMRLERNDGTSILCNATLQLVLLYKHAPDTTHPNSAQKSLSGPEIRNSPSAGSAS